MLRGYRLAGSIAAVTTVGALTACGGGPAAAQSGPGLNCSNYSLHGGGSYHNEASIHVKVTNSTARRARYTVDVDLTAAHGGSGHTPAVHVTIYGSLASHTSGELGRKVLTGDPIQSCRLVRIQQSGS